MYQIRVNTAINPIHSLQIILHVLYGLKTRIDFFCHEAGDVAYDVVESILKFGYKAMVFPPEQQVIQELYLIEPDENGNPMISRIP